MFLHLCVILFTGGVSVPACTIGHMTRGGLCAGGFLSRGVSVQLSLSGGVSVQGVCVWGDLCPGGSLSRGLCPVGSLSIGVTVLGGLCPGGSLSNSGFCQGDPPTETPLYGNARAGRILLECILVYNLCNVIIVKDNIF